MLVLGSMCKEEVAAAVLTHAQLLVKCLEPEELSTHAFSLRAEILELPHDVALCNRCFAFLTLASFFVHQRVAAKGDGGREP